MKIRYGNGQTKYGPGIEINLNGNEIATAVEAYIVARGVCVRGSRTTTINGELIISGKIYVDPSGFVVARGRKVSGRGANKSLDPSAETTRQVR